MPRSVEFHHDERQLYGLRAPRSWENHGEPLEMMADMVSFSHGGVAMGVPQNGRFIMKNPTQMDDGWIDVVVF